MIGRGRIGFRAGASLGLGQQPPGRVEMSKGSPLRNEGECSEIDGRLFNEGRICCNRIYPAKSDAYWLCRGITEVATKPAPTAPPPGTSPYPNYPGMPGYQPPGTPGYPPSGAPGYPAPTQATIMGIPTPVALIGAVALAAVAFMMSRRQTASAPPVFVAAPPVALQPARA